MSVLTELCARSLLRAQKKKETVPPAEMQKRAENNRRAPFCFERAVAKEGLSVICELKKASPSKGLISPDFPYLEIAAEYEAAGADCLSVLTEPTRFLGSDEIFADVRARTELPILRKDFIVDEYQLYETRAMGADAALLIAAVLGERLGAFLRICDGLGLSALTETHDAEEIALAAAAGARLIGVNSRNLHDFSVDPARALSLGKQVPKGALFVAESGMTRPADAVAARLAGADGVLVGEALMRARDRKAFLREAKGG